MEVQRQKVKEISHAVKKRVKQGNHQRKYF